MSKELVKSNKLQIRTVYIFIAIVSIIALGLIFIIRSQDSKNPVSEPTISYSTNLPDESKDNADNYPWNGQPDEPKKLIIPEIDIEVFVQKNGIDSNNQIVVPNNVHLAGWFVDSVKPGLKGLSIISGHVSGKKTDGVFKRLNELAVGDNFEVLLGNDQLLRYKVVDNIRIEQSDANNILFSQKPKIASQINLITCEGSYSHQENQYQDRIIVNGELI